jgi:16S rRNA processing protein RimM
MYIIGKVLKPQGNKGEVKVEIITSFPEHFVSLDSVYFEENKNYQAYSIEATRTTNRFVFLKLENIDSIDQAEKLRNKYCYIKDDELSELAKDEYYIHDLIGMQVFDEAGNHIGEISEVESYPANDVYVVSSPEGVQLNIPAIQEVIKSVDKKENKMTIHILDGLFD